MPTPVIFHLISTLKSLRYHIKAFSIESLIGSSSFKLQQAQCAYKKQRPLSHNEKTLFLFYLLLLRVYLFVSIVINEVGMIGCRFFYMSECPIVQ